MTNEHVVIVGGGTSAGAVVRSLRDGGFEGAVTLVGDESSPPYERPELSKSVLTGAVAAKSVEMRDIDWYRTNDVDIRLDTRVSFVDTANRSVALSTGENVPYDKLVFATGGRPRPLPIADKVEHTGRIHYLRTRQDAEALGKFLVSGQRLVVIGGGVIGCEVAASARALDVEATIIEAGEGLLERSFGPALGAMLSQVHLDNGVDIRMRQSVLEFAVTAGGIQVVTDKSTVEADVVVIGIGLIPNIELAMDCGILCDEGILANEYGETSIRGIYATGDAAQWFHPLYEQHLRFEQHDSAIRQGQAVAQSILGTPTVVSNPPWFWSDQYEDNLQFVGRPSPGDEMVIRGSVSERSMAAFFVGESRINAVFAMNRGREIMAGRRLLTSGVPVEPDLLKDEDVDLRRLGRQRESR